VRFEPAVPLGGFFKRLRCRIQLNTTALHTPYFNRRSQLSQPVIAREDVERTELDLRVLDRFPPRVLCNAIPNAIAMRSQFSGSSGELISRRWPGRTVDSRGSAVGMSITSVQALGALKLEHSRRAGKQVIPAFSANGRNEGKETGSFRSRHSAPARPQRSSSGRCTEEIGR